VPEVVIKQEEDAHPWMLMWIQRVERGLENRNASYKRQELVDYIKACFRYVWMDEGEVDASILYHMLHISDEN
jgi:hypothetical protein